MFFPNVLEKTGRSTRTIDLPSRLLQDRIVYLGGEVSDDTANVVIMQLLWLNADNPHDPVQLYVNSPGGSVYAGLGIKDVMHSISAPVETVGVGLCASMGAYLLSAGTGDRSATENCRIMLHSVSSGHEGSFHDLEVDFHETKFLQDLTMDDLSEFTGGVLSPEEVRKSTYRNHYLSAHEAVDLNLIDRVI